MKICCCCGGRMNLCSPRNPNICLDCEALTLDDSPLLLAAQTEAASAPQEVTGNWFSKHDSTQQALAGGYPNGNTGRDAVTYHVKVR